MPYPISVTIKKNRGGEINGPVTASGGGHDVSVGSSSSSRSLSLALASAFSAVPAAETRAILLGKLRENNIAEEAKRKIGDGTGSSPVVAGNGCYGAMDENRNVGGGARGGGRGGEREDGEGVARAIADACRDIVLKSLLGEATAVGGVGSPSGLRDEKRPA